MKARALHGSPRLTAAMFAVFALFLIPESAFCVHAVEKVIHSFQRSPDGMGSTAGLVVDDAGNLYGTTQYGGSFGHGTVFELSSSATQGGAWTETILYNFAGGASDGASPTGTLTFDKMGNLYGTTVLGGPNDFGAVFELNPPATPGTAWSETVLFIFSNSDQGVNPIGRLIFDGVGNLYGTTRFGGASCSPSDCGTVFQLKPPTTQGGAWKERVLFTYTGPCCDNIPRDLVFQKGALYGTTRLDGTGHAGTIFQLVLENGNWKEKILYNFTGTNDGALPYGGLVADSAGNLYGTAEGGSANRGVVFELSPPAGSGDPWQETTLYTFRGSADGVGALEETLIRDKLGNLYGAAPGGVNGSGAVFKLKAPRTSGGAWTEVILHEFGGSDSGDGNGPFGKLILVNGKGLFGTTMEGGSQNGGTVFNVSFVP